MTDGRDTPQSLLVQALSSIGSGGPVWTGLARVVGLGIGLAQAIGSQAGLPVSAEALGFAGALILLPEAHSNQRRWNRHREDGDDR